MQVNNAGISGFNTDGMVSVHVFFLHSVRVVALSILKASKNDLGFFYTDSGAIQN